MSSRCCSGWASSPGWAELANAVVRDQHPVDISGRDEQLAFLALVGCHGARGDAVDGLRAVLEPLRANTNVDVIPKGIWDHVRQKAMVNRGRFGEGARSADRHAVLRQRALQDECVT